MRQWGRWVGGLAILAGVGLGALVGSGRWGEFLSRAEAVPVFQETQPPTSVPFALQIGFGFGDPPQDRWRGRFQVRAARILESSGWQFSDSDRLSLNEFELETQLPRAKLVSPKGFLLRGEAEAGARIEVSTERGDFSFLLADLPPGRELEFLGGQVQVRGLLGVSKLTDDLRDDDYPSIAARDDEVAWAVWQSYSGESDEIRLSRHEKGWRTFTRVPGTSGDVWRPQVVVDASRRPWVIWSQQQDGNFDLWARALDEERNVWLDPVRLSSRPHPDFDHQAVADSAGRIWVVWQAFDDDNLNIFLRWCEEGRWSEEVRVTDHPANDWEPQVAVDGQGKAYVVWDSYRNGNYDVFLRSFEAGRLGEEIAVADSPRFEAHASAAVDGQGRVWVAWDEGGANWGKDTGPTIDPAWLENGKATWDNWIHQASTPGTRLYESRRIRLAVLEGDRRLAPAADLDEALEKADIYNHDYPQLLAGPQGQMALLFHRWNQNGSREALGFRRAYWEQAAVFWDGSRWSDPVTLPESRGRISLRADAAFTPSGKLWVVWPTDERHKRAPLDLVGNIFAALLETPTRSSTSQLSPFSAPEATPAAPVHPQEAEQTRAIRSYRTFIGGVENQIVRGDFHRHTGLSWDTNGGIVEGSLFDFYRYMLDAAAMDFGGVTDHTPSFEYEYWWWLVQKSCDLYHVPRSFTTFYGYERSVRFPGGHRNIFHTRRGLPVIPFFREVAPDRPRGSTGADPPDLVENDIPLLFEALRESGGLAIPHTTASNMGTDWRYHDPEVQPLVEIFQGDRVSYETEGGPRAPRSAEDNPIGGWQEAGTLWRAYQKGYRIGTIASSDHWSTHISYAMVYTEEPTREAIFDAMRKRRTYGATDNIILDYRIGDTFMGGELATAQVRPLEIRVIGTDRVARLEIIKNEKIVYSVEPGNREVKLTYLDQDVAPGDSYYYVRLVQADRQVAWGSPIWVTYRPLSAQN